MTIFTGHPRDVVLSQINAVNNPLIPFTKENLFFGKPTIGSDGLSTVPVAGALATEYALYSHVKYFRINLNIAFDSVPTVKAVQADTIHEMLSAMSQSLGLSFTEDDIVDRDMTLINPGEEINVEMMATDKSLAYSGRFVIRYQRIREDLAVAVSDNTLSELTQLPDIPADKRSLEMAMYRIDFTSDSADLALWGPTWRDPTKVQALAAANGFPDWPIPEVNGVRDSSTKDEPLANKAFARVAIQKNVVLGNYEGDAYFHYNLT